MSARDRHSEATSKSGSSDGGMAGSSKPASVVEYNWQLNNEASKKYRDKAKERTAATEQRMNILQAENNDLRREISNLITEFRLLKEIFIARLILGTKLE